MTNKQHLKTKGQKATKTNPLIPAVTKPLAECPSDFIRAKLSRFAAVNDFYVEERRVRDEL